MHDNRPMASRLLSFAVWAVVLASALFWGLKVFVPRPALPAQAQAPARSAPAMGDMSRLLGSSAVAAADEDEDEAAPENERFRLLGVVAPRGASHSAQGVALIAVDNEPAKAWRTGATVADGLVLLAVDRRSVKLGPRGGPATTELTLPEADQATAAAPGPAGRLPAMGQVGNVLQGGAQAVPRPGAMQPPAMIQGQVVQRPAQQQAQQNEDEDEDE